MSLSKDDVKKIAALSRIGMSDDEIEKYRKDLSATLDYFKKLEELDTEKIEPIGHITGMENGVRSDKERDFGKIGKDAILKNAPKTKNGQVKVKSIL